LNNNIPNNAKRSQFEASAFFPWALIKPFEVIVAGCNIIKIVGPKHFSIRICEGVSGLTENLNDLMKCLERIEFCS
jgi:hypothetical protein